MAGFGGSYSGDNEGVGVFYKPGACGLAACLQENKIPKFLNMPREGLPITRSGGSPSRGMRLYWIQLPHSGYKKRGGPPICSKMWYADWKSCSVWSYPFLLIFRYVFYILSVKA